jgi:serine/threonine protein kinase
MDLILHSHVFFFAILSSEIQLGKLLGKGGFFTVHEVSKITLRSASDQNNEENGNDNAENHNSSSDESSSTRSEHDNHEDGNGSNNYDELVPSRSEMSKEEINLDISQLNKEDDEFTSVVQDRDFMATRYIRESNDDGKNEESSSYRYCLKAMRPEAYTCNDPSYFVDTVVDQALEVEFLANIRHPNIIKLRAIAAGGPFQHGFFMILDRLYDTLTVRIKSWQKEESTGIWSKFFDFHRKHEKKFLARRLLVAYDIASALEYLHNLNIIYRDLKPDNVGFDVRGDVKLFDFGLAVEYNQENAKKLGHRKLTGDTGTIQYMAPEVALKQPYNETADVYSFAVLLWQCLSLKEPYEGKNDDTIERLVLFAGQRPKIDPHWPAEIRRLLQNCFASNPRRPHMDKVCDILKKEICKVSDKKVFEQEISIGVSARSALSVRLQTK